MYEYKILTKNFSNEWRLMPVHAENAYEAEKTFLKVFPERIVFAVFSPRGTMLYTNQPDEGFETIAKSFLS